MLLLLINDLPLYTNYVSTDLYTEDTTLFDIQDSMDQIGNNLQSALNRICACKEILDYNVEDSREAMSSLKIMSIYD